MKNKTVREILGEYISNRIPKSATNVFYQMFNGIDAIAGHIESYLKVSERERNFTTAQEVKSFRQLAAQNGFEPQLKRPSYGKLYLEPTGELFAKHGSVVYIPAYCEFIDRNTGNTFYYDSPNITKLINQPLIIPVKQGRLTTQSHTLNGEKLQRLYIDSLDVADKSITIYNTETLEQYTQVESFLDSINLYDNRQFILKYSNKPKTPLIVYIKGGTINEQVTISYRLTEGASGNINGQTEFTSTELLNYRGEPINFSDDELTITNTEGFILGSDGSDMNMLKSSIGFNHGVTLLFDVLSYEKFLRAFSVVYLQKVFVDESIKSIKHVYVGKKAIYIGPSEINMNSYIDTVTNQKYLLPANEFEEIRRSLHDNEFALSSHTLNNVEVERFAFQIMFDNITDLSKYKRELELLIYEQFAIFLYDNHHMFDVENFIYKFMVSKNIKLQYIMFNEFMNKDKNITSKTRLPLLNGTFDILDIDNNPVKLYESLTFIVNKH